MCSKTGKRSQWNWSCPTLVLCHKAAVPKVWDHHQHLLVTLLEMQTLGTAADLLESEILKVRSIYSVVLSALWLGPICTKIGEPLKMQAAWRGAEPGDSGKATCTLVRGSGGWMCAIS